MYVEDLPTKDLVLLCKSFWRSYEIQHLATLQQFINRTCNGLLFAYGTFTFSAASNFCPTYKIAPKKSQKNRFLLVLDFCRIVKEFLYLFLQYIAFLHFFSLTLISLLDALVKYIKSRSAFLG